MAKAEFTGYGSGKEDFLEHTTEAGATFVEKQGGPVNAYGEMEKKASSSINMNAGEAFNKKSYTKIDAMGTDMPKKSGKQIEGKNEHFKVGEVNAYGQDCSKKGTGKDNRRS